jgi:hypothetical protein
VTVTSCELHRFVSLSLSYSPANDQVGCSHLEFQHCLVCRRFLSASKAGGKEHQLKEYRSCLFHFVCSKQRLAARVEGSNALALEQ